MEAVSKPNGSVEIVARTALTLSLSQRERGPQERLWNSPLSLWERVGVRVIKSSLALIVARAELAFDF